jgi:hypothetical protein
VDIAEIVLEKFGTTESTTLLLKLWENARVILRDEVLVVRNVDGRLRVAEAPAPRRLGPPVES